MRTTRTLSAKTKELISQSMRKYHAARSEKDKSITRQKQSNSLKKYWQTVPVDGAIVSDSSMTKAIGYRSQPIKNEPRKKEAL